MHVGIRHARPGAFEPPSVSVSFGKQSEANTRRASAVWLDEHLIRQMRAEQGEPLEINGALRTAGTHVEDRRFRLKLNHELRRETEFPLRKPLTAATEHSESQI